MVADGVPHRNWHQVRAWRIMSTMCKQHADRLRSAAEELARHWSPVRSAAAAEFVAFVGDVVSCLLDAAEVAESNAAALESTLESLLVAASRVRDIRDQSSRTRDFQPMA